MESELVALQTQMAFQEDTIAQLNKALTQQQRQIALLQEQFDVLKQQYGELRQHLSSGDGLAAELAMEKPPHY